MSKQHLSKASSLEKVPYGTFSTSHHEQLSNTESARQIKSNTVQSTNNPNDIKDSGDESILVEIPIDPEPDPDSDLSMDFGDTAKLIDHVVKVPSKKDLDEDENIPPVSKNRIVAFLYAYRGIALTLLTSFTISIASAFTKYIIDEGYPATLCLFWRSPIILAYAIGEILYQTVCKKNPIFNTIWPLKEADNRKTLVVLVVCRGVMGPLAVLSQFYAFRYIDLGDAQTIIYSNAVFVTFFAHFILGESWGVIPFIAAIFTILGVMIISKPPFITGSDMDISSDRLTGILLALCAMLLNTFIFILLRFLRNVHSSLAIFLMAFSTMVLGLGMALGNNEFNVTIEEDIHIAAFVALAAFTCIGAITFTLALQYEEAGLVALVRCADVVFSFLFQMILGVYPDWYSIGGTFIVLFCIFVVFFRKYVDKLPPESSLAKHMWFLLK